ncbi:MAG: hypothetical protein WBN23_11070 [Woeseia sp.]
MSLEFFAAILVLVMLALSLIGNPPFRSAARRSAGFVSVPVLFLIAAIIAAIVMYAFLGRPDVALRQLSATPADPATQSSGTSAQTRAGSVSSLLGRLEEKVALDPADGDNWLLLAKSYNHLGRPAKARDAYTKAKALGSVDAGLEHLLSEPQATASADASAVSGRVSLTPAAMSMVEASDTVFIIARDAAGSPMPLAVVKTQASELPFTFSIGDKDSMVSGRNISGVKAVVIEAKISATGDALSTKAGLSARTDPFDPANPPTVSLMLAPVAAGKNAAEL